MKHKLFFPTLFLAGVAVIFFLLLLQSDEFGPAGASAHPRVFAWDLDRDGFDDLVTRFVATETGLVPGDTEVCLTGEGNGSTFEACHPVTVRAPGWWNLFARWLGRH